MISLRILLVDDNELSLRSMEKALKLNGIDVDAEHDVEIALHKHFENEYDIILSDIKMPKLNGFDFTRLIKQKTPHTKVYLFTGSITYATVMIGLDAGAEKVFAKPLPIMELLDSFNLKQMEILESSKL